MYHSHRRSAFTLIELLVVIAIIAILAVVVVLTLNPAQMLAQSRDANRLSDLATMNSAVDLYNTDQSGSPTYSLGTPTTTYLSIYDPAATTTAGTNCATMGLSATSTGWVDQCPASSTYRNVNGLGWIPVNFSKISGGTPFGSLPIDPTNNTSSLFYYTYAMNGSTYELTVPLESQKYLKQDLLVSNTDPARQAIGSNPTLVSQEEGLVGYWNFDEGNGLTANDMSGNGNNGTLLGTSTPAWLSASNCKAGNSCLNFSNGYVLANGVGTGVPFATYTLTGWIKASTTVGTQIFESFGLPYLADNAGKDFFSASISSTQVSLTGKTTLTPGVWYFIVASWDGSNMNLYVNGILDAHQAESGTVGAVSSLYLGNHSSLTYQFFGSLDDIRVYNRALSAAEIQEMYNAEK
jgi:prepilin-type N-terminal cleavage/methylation domain-containing protein